MSTRAVIARAVGENDWQGVYHHWDGYPQALGAALWALHRGHFAGDLAAMLETLIDQHPGGWSDLTDADFSLPAGWVDSPVPARHGPLCYCHGGRQRRDVPWTRERVMGSWIEWAYVFHLPSRTMTVWRPVMGSAGVRAWAAIARLDLTGPEPAWAVLERATRPLG